MESRTDSPAQSRGAARASRWRLPRLLGALFVVALASAQIHAYTMAPPNLAARSRSSSAAPVATSADPSPIAPATADRTAPEQESQAEELDWPTLQGLNYHTGYVEGFLRELDGKRIKLPGYVVPLEDYAERVDEFLLVPYFGACIHTPPPPPNQMVYVKMKGGETASYGWEPIWVEGVLKISNFDSPYGLVGFTLEGMKTAPYVWQ